MNTKDIVEQTNGLQFHTKQSKGLKKTVPAKMMMANLVKKMTPTIPVKCSKIMLKDVTLSELTKIQNILHL